MIPHTRRSSTIHHNVSIVTLAIALLPSAGAFAQAEIASIPFESVPGGIRFVSPGGEPIELLTDTAVAGELTATGTISSSSGFGFPDGTVQVSAARSGLGLTANSGLYSNRIADFSPPHAYTEICFKAGSVSFDIHAASEPTAGGNCVPGDVGWILERFERALGLATWTSARAACLEDGMRLPEIFEWQLACEDAALFAIEDMTDSNNEWVSNTALLLFESANNPIIAAPVAGTLGCTWIFHGQIGAAGGAFSAVEVRCAR